MRRPPERRSAGPLPGPGASEEIARCSNDRSEHTRPARRTSTRRPGLVPIGEIAAEIVANMIFRHKVQRLYALGPRVTAEFLAELGAERGIQTVIDRKLDTFAELDPEAVAAAGGDSFWPAPIHEVPR